MSSDLQRLWNYSTVTVKLNKCPINLPNYITSSLDLYNDMTNALNLAQMISG